MKYRHPFSAIMAACFVLVVGCSKDLPPGNYDVSEVGKVKKVVPGTIISMRQVNIQGKSDAGNASAQNSEYVDANVTTQHGFEYVIKLDSGSIISVVQSEDVHLKANQHILVIYGNNTRLVPDEG